jgi:hypothetical protein
VEPEGSLTCSQEPSTSPYPELEQFSSYHLIISLQDPSWYYPPTHVLVFLVDSFLLVFSPVTFMRSSSPICTTCFASLILLDLTLFWMNLVKSRSYEVLFQNIGSIDILSVSCECSREIFCASVLMKYYMRVVLWSTSFECSGEVLCASTLYEWTVLWWLGHNEYYL